MINDGLTEIFDVYLIDKVSDMKCPMCYDEKTILFFYFFIQSQIHTILFYHIVS